MSRALMSRTALRATRSLMVAALALAGLTCRDNSVMGPGLPGRASFAVVPHFETVPGGPVVQLAKARVQVYRMPVAVGDETVVDTTADFVGNDALTLDLQVQILGASSDFLYKITAMDATGAVIYAATDSVTVVVGTTPDVPENVTLHWATADTLVRSLRVLPRDTVITANEPFTFGVIARKADSSVVVASVGWVSRDESKLHIDQGTGSATALTQFSNVWIVATMGTGLKDSTLVSATQPVTSVVVSPSSATLFINATQQLTAQVSAAGNVPLPTRPVGWTTSNASVATVSSSGLVTAIAVGSATITATSGGVSSTSAITVAKKTPIIAWTAPADITYGTALSATQLNANAVFNAASVPGSFVYTPVAGTVLAAGSAQALSVTFTPADPSTFAGAIGGTTINVLKANQAITFAAIPDHAFGEADFTVSATASSGLAVTFAASGFCTVTGATVHLTGSGSCTITASQAGDANRNAAADVSRSFNVGKASLAIVAASATGVFGGTATLSATVTAGGAPLNGKLVNFSINGVSAGSVATNASGVASLTASIAGLNAGTYVGAITPPAGILASFAGDANFNSSQAVNTLVVTKATATLTLGTLAFAYDGTPKPVTVTTAPAGLSGVTVTYNGAATVPSDAGSYSIVASLTNQNYQAANATGTLTIGQASQTITFAALPPRVLGDPAFTVSATTTAGLPVTFDASGSCTVAGDQVSLVAEGSCTITASQAGNVNFLAATPVSQSFNVGPRPVATVEINPTATVVELNQTVLFTSTAKAANGEVLTGRLVTWTTADAGIATVDASGVATGKGIGQTTITATVEGHAATATLDVQPPPITVDSTRLLSVDGDTLYSIGARRLLDARAYYANVQVAGRFTWRSLDTEVVTVDNFGLVTAIDNGVTQVIVAEDGGSADTIEIAVVQKLARIAITPSYVKLTPGASTTLTASGYDALENPMPVSEQITWRRNNYYGEIVDIDAVTGEVTANNVGNETIIAESGILEARALVEVGTLVRSVVITGGGNFDALGQTLPFTATAYDEGGKPVPGVDVEWESLNESVVRPTSFDGATMLLTSYINGSTSVRATIQGVRGEAIVTVQQRVAQLVVSPVSVELDVLGVAILTAQAVDANGRAMNVDPREITWESANTSVVQVDGTSGVVTAVARSGLPVTVRAMYGTGPFMEGYSSVTVNSPPSALSFGIPLITVGKGQTIPVTLYLNHPSSQQFNVDLSVAGSNAVWKTTSVIIDIGKTIITADITGVTAGTTTITATSREGGWDPATATLAVQPIASIPYVDDSEMNSGEEKVAKVYLNDPAPAGGSWVTFQYSNPGVVSVFPDRAFIPAGQVAADIMVRGIAEGTSTISPVMPGLTGVQTEEITVYPAVISIRSPEVTRVVGAGQFEFGIPNDYDGGGQAIKARAAKARTAQGANKAGSQPRGAPARVATGIGQWADGFYSYGCSDYGEGGEGGYVIEEDGGQGGEVIPDYETQFADYCLRVGNDPSPPLNAQLQSSNTNVLLVESEVTIEDRYAGFAVAGVRPGQAAVTASASGWSSAVVPVVVSTPRLSVLGGYGDLGDSVTLRSGQYYYSYIEVGDSLGNPHPLINSLRIRMTSSDPSVFTINDSVATIDAGESQTNWNFLLAPENPGVAWIRFMSDGHMGDSVMVVVPRQGLEVERVRYVGAGQYSSFQLNTARPTDEFTEVTITSLTDTTSAAISEFYVLEGGAMNIDYRGYTPGSTDFVLTAPGFDPETLTVVVTTPALMFDLDVQDILIGGTNDRALYALDSLGLSHFVIEPVTVTLRSLNESIATVVGSIDLTSYYQSGVVITGVSEGTTQIIAEVPGVYTPDTLTITVNRKRLNFGQEPGQVTVGGAQSHYCYWYGCYTYQPYVTTPDNVADSLVLQISSLTGRTTISQPEIVMYSGNVSQQFAVIGDIAGFDTIIVRDAADVYAPDTMVVQVTASLLRINSSDTTTVSLVNAGGLPSNAYLVDSLYFNSHQIEKTFNLAVTSTDPSVVEVLTPGVTPPTGSEQINFSLTPRSVGEADIILSDPSGQLAPDTVHVIVKGMRLFSDYGTVTVGMRQRADYNANVRHEGAYEGDLVVTLTSSDPNIASVPATVTLPWFDGGATDFPVEGHDTLGTVRVKMEADGFEPAYVDVEVGRPRIYVEVADEEPANSQYTMNIYTTDQYGNQRTPLEDVTFTLISSDPSIASSDSTEITILGNKACEQMESCADRPVMSYWKPGRTVFTARDNRYPALIGYKAFVDTIFVRKPEMYLQALSYYYGSHVGASQVDSLQLVLESGALADVTINLTSEDPTVVEVPATVTVRAGSNFAYVPVYGRSLNADGAYIYASAPGYFGSNAYVRTRLGEVEIQPLASFTPGVASYVSLITMDPLESYNRGYSAVTTPQTFTLSGDPAAVKFYKTDGVTEITSVTINPGEYEAQFTVKPLNLGSFSFDVSGNANFNNRTYSTFIYAAGTEKSVSSAPNR